MNIVFDIIEGIINIIIEFFKIIFELFGMAFKKKGSYNAEFVSQGTLLSSSYKGFCLTGNKNLSVKNSYQNALVIGGTGTGKSSVVLTPSLFTMRSSFVVHDPSGELLSMCGGYLHSKGYDVKVLNFANPANSCNYNPLARAEGSDIQKIASMLISNALGGNSKDPFWNNSSSSLLTALIGILKTQEEKYQNLYNVRHLLNNMGSNSDGGVDNLFSTHADKVLFSEYKAFLSYDDKVLSGIIATCRAALLSFADNSIAQITASDNLNLMDFRNKRVALFIQNKISDQKYYSTLSSIFFEQFFSFIMSRFPDKNENDIFFLVDEASSLNLPTLPTAVANVRKHRSGIMLMLQDFNQLVHNYGKFDAESIKTNCFSKLFFTGQNLDSALELEKILGRAEYENDKGNKVVRSLMTNDEIRTMKSNRALLICGHHPPIKAKLKPYYKRTTFRNYSNYPIPPFNNTEVPDSIPILPLKTHSAKNNENYK